MKSLLVLTVSIQLTFSTWMLCSVSSFSPHARVVGGQFLRRIPSKVASQQRGRSIWMKDYPKPNVENTENYRIANDLSTSFKTTLRSTETSKKKVAIIGGGLSGLACAKYLVDAGHEPFVYEAR